MGSNAPFRLSAVHKPRANSPTPSATTYTHNPYCALAPYELVEGSPSALMPLVVPECNVHKALIGRVEFNSFPVLRPLPPSPCVLPKQELTRLFFGQLPYKVTDEMLSWMCEQFAESRIEYPERITRDFNGRRQLTGCIHAYTEPENADYVIRGISKRVLVDNTGVWYARNEEQLRCLDAYVAAMKRDRSLRPEGMPYDTVVVERAKSTYVPPVAVEARPVSAGPHAWPSDALYADEFTA